MIKVGIIGLGYWGTILYNSLSTNKNFEVVKVCGRDKKNYGNIFTYDSNDVINSDVDLIIVSTQTKYHYEHIISAINSRKNVFVEKPICLTKKEAEEVIKLSDEKNTLLFVDHIYTTNPYVNKIKEIINRDIIKTYLSIRYNENCKLFDTTIIENLMYHDFYMFNHLIGDLNYEDYIIDHIPFKWCDLKFGNINFKSSYRDKKTRNLFIETNNNSVFWDEIKNELIINNERVTINPECDNINYKFNDIYSHIINKKDDGSKYDSLNIIKFIDEL